MKKSFVRGLAAASLVAGSAAHAVVPEAVGTSITAGVTDILTVIGLGGAAMLTIAGGGVVWQVASKFVKRLGGKA